MKLNLLTICLIFYSLILHAQNLKIDEVIAMRKSTGAQIDSIMKAKGFVKNIVQQNTDYSIITYTLTALGNRFTQRSLHIGRRPKIHSIELQYGVWQKQDATDIIDQLTQAGFKKVSMQIPDMDGKSSTGTVSYRKGGNRISYEEQNQGVNRTLYIFSVNSADYK